MTYEDVGKQLADAALRGAMRIFTEGRFVEPDYAHRVKIDGEFMKSVWGMVDKERLKQQIARRLEEELADRRVNSIAAELSTDIKSILSVPERREALRSIARQHIDSVLNL